MAPSPRRHTALLLLLLSLLLLLLLSAVVTHPAKEAAASSRSHAELQDYHGEVDEDTTSFLTAADERCGGAGGEAEEECLMRRTLVAHTDYIYTQGSHN
ncbi:phytosulfokines-like [Phragmites australis]|uniref:phytosulfokines-like n=1 Tax=Phragmites australis TaxID=29695 RepID=UPI002D7868B9|nr:phytosulfokines-like [Phragmites australis]